MDPKLLTKIKKKMKLKTIEVASSPFQLMKGLMFRKQLPAGSGMLFDFHYSDRHGIWMLFMRFPIDVYFLDEKGRKINKIKNARPFSIFRPSTWRIYRPKRACRYAVEVASSSHR